MRLEGRQNCRHDSVSIRDQSFHKAAAWVGVKWIPALALAACNNDGGCSRERGGAQDDVPDEGRQLCASMSVAWCLARLPVLCWGDLKSSGVPYAHF